MPITHNPIKIGIRRGLNELLTIIDKDVPLQSEFISKVFEAKEVDKSGIEIMQCETNHLGDGSCIGEV